MAKEKAAVKKPVAKKAAVKKTAVKTAVKKVAASTNFSLEDFVGRKLLDIGNDDRKSHKDKKVMNLMFSGGLKLVVSGDDISISKSKGSGDE